MAERILTNRELNRATLARQLLLERSTLSPLDALQQLAGLQAQLPNPPYIGLWSRLHSFQRDDLTQLLKDRQTVRTTMMRGTLHLTTAEDFMYFRSALQHLHRRGLDTYFETASQQLQNGTTPPIEKARLISEIQSYVQEQPRTNVHLRKKIAELIPGMGDQLLYKVRSYLPLIQTFPAGAWNVGGSPAYTEASAWLGRTFATPQAGLRYLIRRYLAAFGPASVKDIQAGSGLKRLQEAVDALRPELIIYRDGQGREFFDLPGAPLPSIDTPAPIRFIPMFDNLVLAHDDRSRIIADEYKPIVFPGLSVVHPTILIDGYVQGIWRIEGKNKLIIEPFTSLPATTQQALQQEAEKHMNWISDGPEPSEIQLITPTARA